MDLEPENKFYSTNIHEPRVEFPVSPGHSVLGQNTETSISSAVYVQLSNSNSPLGCIFKKKKKKSIIRKLSQSYRGSL